MSKTAEDRLNDINFEDRATDCQFNDGSRNYEKAVALKHDTQVAMDDHAQERAEGFAEWAAYNAYVQFEVGKWTDNWVDNITGENLIADPERTYATAELYTIYIKHLKNHQHE